MHRMIRNPLFILMGLCWLGSFGIQGSGNLEAARRERLPLPPITPSDPRDVQPETFRQNLFSIIGQSTRLGIELGYSPQVLEELEFSQQQLESFSLQDFAEISQELGPRVGQLTRALEELEALTDAAKEGGTADPAGNVLYSSDGWPMPAYPNDEEWSFNLGDKKDHKEPDEGEKGGEVDENKRKKSGICGPANRLDTAGMFGLLTGVLVAEGVKEVASRICELDVIAAGFGGNGSLICIVSDLVYLALRGSYDFVTLCQDAFAGAEAVASFERLDHLHNDLNSMAAQATNTSNSLSNGINASLTALGDVLGGVDGNFTLLQGQKQQLFDHQSFLNQAYGRLVGDVSTVNNALSGHDTDIKGRLDLQDGALSTHDSEIKAALLSQSAGTNSNLTAHNSNLNNQSSQIQSLLGVAQASLDNQVEQKRVHLIIMEMKDKESYLMAATEAGKPVEVTVTSVQTAEKKDLVFSEVLPLTDVSNLGNGLYLVELRPAARKKLDLMTISVVHEDRTSSDHYGFAMFHLDTSRSFGTQ